MSFPFKINRKDETLTWQTVQARIKTGFELQDYPDELTSEHILKFNDSIIIDPDYQRKYRSSVSDESSLIESALLDIPIPPVFLASQKLKGVQVLNVVDGQHRLRAFYRYINNDYALKGLKLLSDLNDKKFNDLTIDDKTSLLSKGISSITFRDFPGKEFELEIFSRYNKGTKPLTAQEIRHAVYASKVNDMVNSFCARLLKEKDSPLAIAYAISKDRYQKKTCQENIFVILSILEYGVIQFFKNDKGVTQKVMKSPQYAEVYMRKKSEDESNYEDTWSKFQKFNEFISFLCIKTKNPFSREIYGVTERGNKFQVSISMILAGVFHQMLLSDYRHTDFADIELLDTFINKFSHALSNSYLEDPEYNASTTNPVEIDKLVSSFVF